MKIGIIGMGFVGTALSKMLEKAHEIIGYDKYKTGYMPIENVASCNMIFIAVPTPMQKSGKINLCSIYNSIDLLNKYIDNPHQRRLIIIRSTAVSGTTDKLAIQYSQFDFAFVPEFLREKTANEDAINTNRIIIGAESHKVHNIIKQVFIEAGHNEEKCKYVFVNRKTAEAIKYSSNIYLASKITFANELYNICNTIGVNYQEVIDAICLDPRIGWNYGWKVPGEDGKKGFSGRCFPKDLNAFIYLSKEHGYRPYFLEEIWRSNLSFRGVEDWLEIEGVTGEKNESY